MFNVSSCVKCGNGMFKVVEKELTGANFKLNFVQCSSCNTPVGVLDYYNIGSLLKTQEKALKDLDSRISTIEHNLNQIINFLNQRL